MVTRLLMTAMAALKLVLSLLWVGVGTSSVVNLEKRIIGGRPCGPTENLHHVLLLRSNGQFCGGSLIPNQWILTAAHCWTDGVDTTAVLGVHTGSRFPVKISESPTIYEDVSHGQVRRHDLMLLKLPDSVQLPSNVKPIDLPDCEEQPRVHDMVQISGQGSSTMGPNNERQPVFKPTTLQCADIEVADCSHITLKHTNYKYKQWFCGQSPGVDVCYGDSGGGVVFRGMIYGVNAFTMDSDACTKPAGFQNICHKPYLKWIKKTIGLTSDKSKLLNCFG